MISFRNDCHELHANASSFALIAYIVKWHCCTTGDTACSLPVDRAVLRLAFACLYGKVNNRRCNTIINVWLNPGLFALLFGKPPFTCERHLCTASGIWTGDGANP